MTRYRIIRKLLRMGRSFWPLGLFAFYLLIALSFSRMHATVILQICGLAIVICAMLAWLVHDYVKDSENRIKHQLDDMSDLLAPYDGLKLKEMPPEIQAEVRRRLGWSASLPPVAAPPRKRFSFRRTKKASE